MPFNVDRYMHEKFVERTQEVPVSDLRKYFGEGEKPVWILRGLTGREIGQANEVTASQAVSKQVLEGMATALEKNQLPRILRDITTKGMIESLMGRGYRRPGLHYSTVRDVLKVTKSMKAVRKERA